MEPGEEETAGSWFRCLLFLVPGSRFRLCCLIMIKAAIIFGSLPPAALPGWATAGAGRYLAYVAPGGGPEDLDFSAPAGFAQAGDPTAYVRGYSFAADVRHVVALRAVSDAGVEEENITCWCTLTIDGEGDLAGSRPSALLSAVAEQAADGYIDVHVAYSRLEERAYASRIDVAALSGDHADWDSVIGTVSLGAGQYSEETITVGPFAEGEAVRLAARAVSAEEVAGPQAWCEPVAPDATGPDPAASLSAEVF